MKLIKILLFVFFVCGSLFAYSDQSKSDSYRIDSLQKLLKTAKEDTNKVKILINLYSETKSNDNNKSKIYLEIALQLSKKINYKRGMAKSTGNLGNYYRDVCDYKNAIKCFLKTQEYFEQMNDTKGVAQTYYSIASIYYLMKNYDISLKYADKSYDILLKTNNKDSEYIKADILCLRGLVYRLKRNFEESIKNYLESLKIYKKLNDEEDISLTLNNKGSLYNAKKQYDVALKYIKESLSIAISINNKNMIKMSYGFIADVYAHMGKYKDALYNYKKEYMYIDSNDIYSLYEHYQQLAQVYDLMGKYKEAVKYYKLKQEFQDSIYTLNIHKQISDLEVKYETEKKEQQLKVANLNFAKEKEKVQKQRAYFISGLGVLILLAFGGYILYRNREIKKRGRLEKELNQYMQKALSQQMNPHFIFNSLNSIQYYLLKNDKITSNKYLTKFARLMRVTLENSQHNTVTVEKEMEALGLYLELEQLRLEGKFDYEIKIDEEIEEQSDMIPTLLLQPFVENSIWHGLMNKQEKGKVTVDVKIVDNIIVCRIEDDGIGREKAMEINREKRKAHKSLGLEITNKRLELINSLYGKEMHTEVTDLKNEKNEGIGTRVEIFLPFMN